MCIDGHISSSAGQALMLPVWNVFFGLWVDVFFGQAKVNDVDDVFLFIPLPSDEKVFRFYISIDEIFWVHIFHPRNLVREKTAESGEKKKKVRSNHKPNYKVSRMGIEMTKLLSNCQKRQFASSICQSSHERCNTVLPEWLISALLHTKGALSPFYTERSGY